MAMQEMWFSAADGLTDKGETAVLPGPYVLECPPHYESQ